MLLNFEAARRILDSGRCDDCIVLYCVRLRRMHVITIVSREDYSEEWITIH